MNKREYGGAGEDLAAAYLAFRGFDILERSFTTKLGEIDIVAEKDGVCHFVEVKTRSGDCFGLPSEAVDRKKLLHITRAAQIYMADRAPDIPWTIDVIEIGVNMLEGVSSYAR